MFPALREMAVDAASSHADIANLVSALASCSTMSAAFSPIIIAAALGFAG